MNEKGAHRVYVSIPEMLFTEMKKLGLLEEIDMLVTNLIIKEIMQKKEHLRNDEKGREQGKDNTL